jgi:hypothetical protein
MVYTAKTAKQLREEAGSLLTKIATENALIDAAIDAAAGGAGSALAAAHIIVGNGAGTATDVAMSGDIAIDNAGATTIGAGKVTLANHVAASEDGTVCKVVAEDAVIGGIPVVFEVAIAAGELATKNIASTHKIRILDAYVIMKGAGVLNTTLTVVDNAGAAITSAMDVSGADKALIRTTAIDDAKYTIGAGENFGIKTETGATQPACLVVVNAVRVA